MVKEVAEAVYDVMKNKPRIRKKKVKIPPNGRRIMRLKELINKDYDLQK